MRLSVITLLALSLNVFITTAQEKQASENPFDKLGYDPLVATSSRGEFAEFHDQADIIEIGSVLFNTKTNEVVKILNEGETTIDLSSATTAMSIDPLCEQYYWISPYAYCLNNPVKFVDKDGKQVGFPINSPFGTSAQLQSYAAQQKVEKIAIDAVIPVGVSVSLNGNVSGGIEGGFSFSAAYLTDGIDAGTLNGYAKGSGGAGVPGGSLTLGVELIYFSGNKANFTAQSLEGGATDGSIMIGEGVVGGVSHSRGEQKSDGQVTTSGLKLGAGVGLLPVSASGGVSTSAQFAGAKDNKQKQEQLNQQKEQQQQQQNHYEQQNQQGMFSSFWNWLTN